MSDPFDYLDESQNQALRKLAELGACVGAVDTESIRIEFTPAWGVRPIGDGEMATVVTSVNALGNVAELELGDTSITDECGEQLARLHNLRYLSSL